MYVLVAGSMYTTNTDSDERVTTIVANAFTTRRRSQIAKIVDPIGTLLYYVAGIPTSGCGLWIEAASHEFFGPTRLK
jgi:hypothetical protein